MNDAAIKKVLERWPQLRYSGEPSSGVYLFKNDGPAYKRLGYVEIAFVNLPGANTGLYLSAARKKHVKRNVYSNRFDSIDAAASYCLIEGLLV